MKLTKQQLKQIIKEELRGINEEPDFESTYRPPYLIAFDKMKELYDSSDPDKKEWFENKLIEEFKKLVKIWREERKSPSDTESDY